MESAEVRKLAALENRHWWYAERRHLLRGVVTAERHLPVKQLPGVSLLARVRPA